MNSYSSLSASQRRARSALLAVLLHSSFGCAAPEIPIRTLEPQAPVFEVGTRVYERFDPQSHALLRRWHVTTTAEGLALLDGDDEGWWPDGTKRHDREWALGEEAGTWWSWHENKALRSLAEFDAGVGVMRFWSSNGVLSAEGSHEGGTREGGWTFWNLNGMKTSSGPFVRNLREGPWTFWNERGEIEAAGLYSAGARVGEWLLIPLSSEEKDEE